MHESDRTILTRAQVRRIDQLATDQLGIPSIVLMENAGRNAARLIDQHYPDAGRILVFCGTGNNGGDGFVIARYLCNAGHQVEIDVAGSEERMSDDAATNHRIAVRMEIPIRSLESEQQVRAACDEIQPTDVLVDALLGTGFSGTVREPMATLITLINASPAVATVAVDVPSGLDCDEGTVANVAVKADMTVSFVARKPGYVRDQGPRYAGKVHIADIGTPPWLIDRVRQGDV